MANKGSKPPRRRRAFTSEFKAEIVEQCLRGDRSVGQVSRDFDLTETAVREWVKQAQRDAGERLDGLTSEDGCVSVGRPHLGRLCQSYLAPPWHGRRGVSVLVGPTCRRVGVVLTVI